MRYGIQKTRVEEVCADAGVSKRTFYKYFRDKNDLAIEVLGEIFETSRARVEAVLSLDCPVKDKVRQIIEVKLELASEISATFYRSALDDSTTPGQFVLIEQQKWDQHLRRFYIEAQAQGLIRNDIDIDVLMTLLVRFRGLMNDPELAQLVPDMGQLAEIVMTVCFYGIVPRGSTDKKDSDQTLD
jgi:AcrR family transcriptional regulator